MPLNILAPVDLEKELILAMDCELFLGPGGPFPLAGVTHIHFVDLTPALLAELKPSLIILPLFAASYDAIAAVEMLESLRYEGHITVLGPKLPRPALVERELRGMGPGARLTLISP